MRESRELGMEAMVMSFCHLGPTSPPAWFVVVISGGGGGRNIISNTKEAMNKTQDATNGQEAVV